MTVTNQIRTRIKICGITQPHDLHAAVQAGADAIGLVFYPGSPRYITLSQAQLLAKEVPGFVTLVGLFVNADIAQITQTCQEVPLQLLQFHGDETAEQCLAAARAVGRSYLRAARVTPQIDLIKFAQEYHSAQHLLLDAHVSGYGGAGQVFDWSLIPSELAPKIILGGGLNPQNVAEAIMHIRPYAVDVSSGVESTKGVKDANLIRQFIATVRAADNIGTIKRDKIK